MRVRWRLTKARHAPFLLKWSSGLSSLRSVTSAWLGAIVVAFKSESAPAGVRVRKSLVLYLPRVICFLRIIIIIIIIIIMIIIIIIIIIIIDTRITDSSKSFLRTTFQP